MAADVGISQAGAIPGDAGQEAKLQKFEKRKMSVFPWSQAHYFDIPSGGRPAQKPSKTIC